MSSAIVVATGVVKDLGQGAAQVRALKGVDVTLQGGELTLLMGPSGSGKTTLLSILGCILTPGEGEIEIAGERTTALSAEKLAAVRRRHVGFIFQEYNLFPTLSAAENVRLALDVRGYVKRGIAAEASRALAAVGLADRERSRPRELSGGQQQRVAIARALAGTPSLILADEPTAALDSDNGKAVMELLAGIAKEPSRAVLVVTHDPRIVPFADRILSIEDGRITADVLGRGTASGGRATGGSMMSARHIKRRRRGKNV